MSIQPTHSRTYPALSADFAGRAERLIAAAERFAAPLGRILLSQIFLISGVMKIVQWSQTEAMMAKKGMPAVPLFLVGAIFCELVGGLSLLLGYRARLGALLLFLYLIPTTLVFHSFWHYQGPEHVEQMHNFMKNIAIMGGLLMITSLGAGWLSLDHSLRGPTGNDGRLR